MAAIEKCSVQCGKCHTLQNCMIFFGDTQSFEAATTSRNRQQCVKCGAMIECNKNNMSYVLKGGDGGNVGGDF